MQEGLIFVWQTLERGILPAATQIENRMKDWVRLLGTQVGRGRGKDGEAVEYAELLPLEDFSETHVIGVDGRGTLPNVGPDLDY